SDPRSERPEVHPRCRGALTESERAFVATLDPSQDLRVAFSWRAEALVSLLWALGHMGSLHPLNTQIDLGPLVALLQRAVRDPVAFIAASRLRPFTEIEDGESDLYHQHWRVRDAQLFGKPMPPERAREVVCERRYGLSWIVGWGDSWDSVPTDT